MYILYMQSCKNNYPKSRSHLRKKLLKKGRTKRDLGVMGFPPPSPDVNPIEHFWEHLKQKEVRHNPTSLNNLRDVINDCWKR